MLNTQQENIELEVIRQKSLNKQADQQKDEKIDEIKDFQEQTENLQIKYDQSELRNASLVDELSKF